MQKTIRSYLETITRGYSSLLIVAMSLGCANSAHSSPITINPGDTLSVGFRFDSPYTSTPNLLGWGFNTDYTGEHTSSLYEGDTLLGTFTQSSGGSIMGFFKSAGNTWPGGTIVDFTSIANRSINGRIDFSVSTGPVQFDPVGSITDYPVGGPYINVSTCPSIFSGVCSFAAPWPYATITSISLNGANLITPLPPPPPPPLNIIPKTIIPISSGVKAGKGEYGLSFDGHNFMIDFSIGFQGDPVSDELLNTWMNGIRDLWNNQYAIFDGEKTYPLLFDLTFIKGYSSAVAAPDVIVTVHDQAADLTSTKSGDRPDVTNWYTILFGTKKGPDGNPVDEPLQYLEDQVAAHEFGHMLGLYDEYPEGNLGPDPFICTDTPPCSAKVGLMGGYGAPVVDRYFAQILASINDLEPGRNLVLGQSPLFTPYLGLDPVPDGVTLETPPTNGVPEPPTLVLMLSILFLPLLRRMPQLAIHHS